MRIAYLSTFYPFRGGIAQFNADLLEAFAAKNEVKAFTFTRQYPDFLFPGTSQYVTDKDKAKVVESEAVLDTCNPFSYFSAARRIAAWNPDIVVMKYWMSYLAPSLGTVAKLLKRKGIKVITILDNVIPHERRFFDRLFSEWFLKQNSGCVAMSRSVLDDMLSLTPDKPWVLRDHPLYNHFGDKMERTAACSTLGLDASRRNLLFFGLIRDYKGLDLLIEAMHLLGEGYTLIIAGESYGDFGKYRKLIDGLPAERVRVFNRYIPDDEVPAFFSAADLCVLPYRSATQSGITAISTHFSLPVAATPVGALPRSVGDTGIGIITSGISSEDICTAIKRYFAEGPAKYLEAIGKIKEDATWANFADTITSFAENMPASID